MNCPNCNSELKQGTKFCTKCGQKVEPEATCPQCGSPLNKNAKFCTKCGTRLAQPERAPESKAAPAPTTPDMNTTKGRIIWNVQPGQVARIISEGELDTYKDIKGVIVPEGTTAYIRANGHTIASISGGFYDITPANTTTAFGQLVKNGIRFIVGLFDKKKKDATEPSKEELYLQQQKAIIENAQKGASFSIVILLDKAFPLTIGAQRDNIDDYKNFEPMTIQTRGDVLSLGVNAYFKISDHERFILHFLTDKKQLSSANIVDEITATVRVTIQEVLGERDLKAGRIPTELNALLKEKINSAIQEMFFGLSVVRIVEISSGNEELKRFAELSKELYLSEQELDYLRRTNDFKNRLADTVNEQMLHEAKSEAEIVNKLREINRNSRNEELLHEDELRKFEQLLVNERIVREAKSDNERDAALAEILKTGLVREEEVNELAHQIATKTQQRNSALNMMRLQDQIEFERVRMQGETDLAVQAAKKQLAYQSTIDQYKDERFYKEIEKQRHVADTNLDLEQRRRDMNFNDEKRRRELDREDDDAQLRQFLAIQEAEEHSRENQRRHEAEMEQNRLKSAEEMERLKWENAQNLSDEKVWALKGGDAATAYAQSKYNAEHERQTSERLEAQRREQEARLDAERAARDADQQDTKERMFEMMNNMMAMAGGMQAQRMNEQRTQDKLNEQERMLRERDERIQKQERRMDTAYDRALDYTTRNNVPPAQPVQQQSVQQQSLQSKSANNVCPECGETIEPGAAFCENCGAPLK